PPVRGGHDQRVPPEPARRGVAAAEPHAGDSGAAAAHGVPTSAGGRAAAHPIAHRARGGVAALPAAPVALRAPPVEDLPAHLPPFLVAGSPGLAPFPTAGPARDRRDSGSPRVPPVAVPPVVALAGLRPVRGHLQL